MTFSCCFFFPLVVSVVCFLLGFLVVFSFFLLLLYLLCDHCGFWFWVLVVFGNFLGWLVLGNWFSLFLLLLYLVFVLYLLVLNILSYYQVGSLVRLC